METPYNPKGKDHNLGEHQEMHSDYRDSTSPVWDMSQERAFIENLLSQRFNFFLVFFSLTIAGFVNTKNLIYAEIILILGAFITSLLAATLWRSQEKLDIILNNDIFLDESHPARIVDKAAKGKSKRGIIGKIIPTICSCVLILFAIVHLIYMIFFIGCSCKCGPC